MPKRETNLVPESHIQDGQKSFFHEKFTTSSLNQREEKLLGGKTKMRKVGPVTAGIHWFRRFLGILNLTVASGRRSHRRQCCQGMQALRNRA